MNAEHTKYLYDAYSALYAQHALPMAVTCMCWGFNCGDGWFDIIDDLSRRITELDKRDGVQTEAVQVKEKFGTLRFYVDGGSEGVWEAISEAEGRSAVTCEECGKPGQLREGGWLRTLCDECAGKRAKEPT